MSSRDRRVRSFRGGSAIKGGCSAASREQQHEQRAAQRAAAAARAVARSPLRGVTRVLPMSGRRGRVSSVHYIFPCAVHLTSTHQADGCDAIRSRSESFSMLWPDVRTWPGQCPSLSAFAPELPASCRSYDGCTWSMPSRTKAGPGGFAQALACRLRSAAKTMLCTSGYEVPHQLWPAGCGRRPRRSRTEYALHNKGCPGGFAQALACRLRSAAKTMLCTSGYDVLHQLWPAGCGRRPRRSHEEWPSITKAALGACTSSGLPASVGG